jgi:tetratricopeptide (TPR) repeat protein
MRITNHYRRMCLIFSLLICLPVPGLITSGPMSYHDTGTQTSRGFDPYAYLPAGAVVKNPDKDVIFADIDGDSKREAVIFYHTSDKGNPYANVLVLKPTDGDYVRLWENIYEGGWGFAAPSGVYDLNKSGKPQIVAYRTVGASCPGVLDIYQYRNGAVERITGAWADNGQCQSVEVKDLNRDGVREIIVRTKNYGVNPDIYRWDGEKYVNSNDKFPGYYNAELEKLVRAIRSLEALPASARVRWAEQAARIYLLQRRYTEALRLGEEVLEIIDNPSLTVPNATPKGQMTPEQRDRTAASLEVEQIQGKATIYHLLGDAYKAAGDLQQAESQYERAKTLEVEAKEKASALRR